MKFFKNLDKEKIKNKILKIVKSKAFIIVITLIILDLVLGFISRALINKLPEQSAAYRWSADGKMMAQVSVFFTEDQMIDTNFIKKMEYSEIGVIREQLPKITVELFGNEAGCIIDREPSEEDIRSAQQGLARAKAVLTGGEFDLVILDELTIPIAFGLITTEAVLDLVKDKPENVELVITGRNAPQELIEAADLVTEMKEIKHYYQEGVLSRRGIEC